MSIKENKLTAQIAGAYLGCDVKHSTMGRSGIGKLTAIRKDVLGISDEDDIYGSWINTDYCQLLLRPLSEITDEDAVQVANMKKRECHTEFTVSNMQHALHQTSKDGYNILWIDFQSFSINHAGHSQVHKHKIGISTWGSVTHYYDGELSQVNDSRQIIDYLRSRSYDCGYGNIPSLIQAGIAIPLTDKN